MGCWGYSFIQAGRGGGGHGSQSLVVILQLCGAHSGKHALIQTVSDLQFVLDHVKGVIGKVHLLNAVDDLLLRLWVDGLLPQLPQLLLKVREREKRIKDALEVSTLES